MRVGILVTHRFFQLFPHCPQMHLFSPVFSNISFSPTSFLTFTTTSFETKSRNASHRVCICLELLLVPLNLGESIFDPVHAALDLVVHARDLPLQDVAVSLLARVADLDKEVLCMGIILKEGARYLFITVGAQADVRLLRTYCTPGFF